MSYVALRFDVEDHEADAWSDALLELGALSVDISDPREGTADEAPLYAEPGLPSAVLWPVSRLSALFDRGVDPNRALARAAAGMGRQVPPSESHAFGEQDWVRATQSQFGPIRIAADLWIVPSWCEPPDPTAVNLALDPGVAFGTGTHPTTRLCLEWLREEVAPGDSVLDYGCGSGILAIAAALLGAGRVAGTDIDPRALAASAVNAGANRVDARFAAPAELPQGVFDIVVANILSEPLMLLAPALAARVNEGGRIALSGILEAQADAVSARYREWFDIAPSRAAEGWVLIAGVRRSRASDDAAAG